MKPYKWEETEEQYIAVRKPKELFVEGSICEASRYQYETDWHGILKKSGEEDVYAFGFLKKWCSKKQAKKIVSWINDALTWKVEEEKHQDRQVA
ncbi:MAG: hypothetical protein K8T10_12400 [Candidatus Eremiobacteraeota bacterium]|nr:hypothetical protein [Candidatus Eremiobacteraeota bacterium]